MGYSFRLTASHRQDSTYHGLWYTSRGALAGTRKQNKVLARYHVGLHLVVPGIIWLNSFVTFFGNITNIYFSILFTSFVYKYRALDCINLFNFFYEFSHIFCLWVFVRLFNVYK